MTQHLGLVLDLESSKESMCFLIQQLNDALKDNFTTPKNNNMRGESPSDIEHEHHSLLMFEHKNPKTTILNNYFRWAPGLF